jgi:hypothetical protein
VLRCESLSFYLLDTEEQNKILKFFKKDIVEVWPELSELIWNKVFVDE